MDFMSNTPHRTGRSIEVPGIGHRSAPIPLGARVGPVLYSSGIAGTDPATSQLPSDPTAQVRFAFANMCALLDCGNASLADVVRVTVYLKDNSCRDAVNQEWIRLFPDPHDRPARHALIYDLQNGMSIQLEVVAVVAPQAEADR